MIVGYDEEHTDPACYPSSSDCQYKGDNAADTRSGSHNLIVGVDHSYSSYAGFVAGLNNTISGAFAPVSGGQINTASGVGVSVSGGLINTASGIQSSVSGGLANRASGIWSSVSGGAGNTASGPATTVAGGRDGTIADVAGDEYDSLIGNEPFADG